MAQQTRELPIELMIVLVASLFYVACQRGSESSSDELKPHASAVQIGEMAPNFTLEDHHNQKVTLSAARASAPTVLVFYRGYW